MAGRGEGAHSHNVTVTLTVIAVVVRSRHPAVHIGNDSCLNTRHKLTVTPNLANDVL